MSAFEKLSARQRKAIELRLTNPAVTLTDIAAAVGVNERTCRRWLKQPEFRATIEATSREALADAVARLRALSLRAVVTLSKALDGQADAVQVRAVQVVLGHLMQLELRDAIELNRVRELVSAMQATLARHATPDVCDRIFSEWQRLQV